MSYSRYLAAVTAALHETVLPELKSESAKDAILLSASVLAAIGASLERAKADLIHSVPDFPASVKGLQHAPEDASGEARPSPPVPPVDLAGSLEVMPTIKRAATWLATQPWASDSATLNTAVALLKWEAALRTDALDRVRQNERGLEAQEAQPTASDINQPALEHYLRERLSSTTLRVTDFRRLGGGRGRQTALFTIDGATLPAQLVLQREHPGGIKTFAGPAMQFPVLEFLHAAGVKVPRPIMMELSSQPLGAAFLVSERVRGRSPMPSMGYWSPPPKPHKLALDLAQQFARLHALPVSNLESVLARTADRSTDMWLHDVDTQASKWRDLTEHPSLAVDAALAWLRAHAKCVRHAESIVHGDAMLHNVLVQDDEITAIVDWEAAHIGHPYEDLGYVRPMIEQMIEWNTFLDAYVDAGGHRPTNEEIDFFTLRQLLWLITSCLYARRAFDAGHTNDLAMAEVGASFVPKLIDRLATQLLSIVKV